MMWRSTPWPPPARHPKSVILLLLTATVGTAQGAGFALIERDASGLGRAYAGQAAVVSPAAVAFNPAALPATTTLSANVSQLWNQLTADSGIEAGTDATVPALFATHRHVGLGLYGSFGLATEYPHDWQGREHALYSGITAARLQVAGAHRLTPTLRLGGGLFLQHFAAELTNAVPTPAGERVMRIEGTDTGLGWALGLLWSASATTSVGLSYTSAVAHQLRGSATTPVGTLAARVPVTTPEVVHGGVRWSATPELALLAGASWTRWSRLKSLDISLANGAVLREAHAWRDTWRLDLGGESQYGPWTLRMGMAWDQSPIPDAAHRTPRLPDSDRTWLAGGFDYQAGPWTWSLGYAHLWFAGGRGTHSPIDYRASSHILAAGLTRTW